MIKYLQLPFHFDVQKLQEEVQLLDTAQWQLHYQKLHYKGEWSAIPLRSAGGKPDNIIISQQNNIACMDTVFLDSCPYIRQVLQTFKCPLQAVRLLKLNAGAMIKEHRDAELSFEHTEIRLHIPVKTDPEVEFYLDKERMNLQEGECWYMNFNLPHSIHNKSSIHRVHLVIDALVNDWVKDIFNNDNVPVKKEIADSAKQYDSETKKQMIILLREMNTATANKMAERLEKELLQLK